MSAGMTLGVFLLLAAGVVDCGPAPGEVPSRALCEGLCEKLERCGVKADRSRCVVTCLEDRAYSAEYWRARAACTRLADCADLKDGELEDCLSDRLADLDPLPVEVIGPCGQMASGLQACNRSLDRQALGERCLEGPGRFLAPALLEELWICFASTGCAEIPGCVQTTLERFEADFAFEELLAWVGLWPTGDGRVATTDRPDDCQRAAALRSRLIGDACQSRRECCYCRCRRLGMTQDREAAGCLCTTQVGAGPTPCQGEALDDSRQLLLGDSALRQEIQAGVDTLCQSPR